jgi:4-amino-4-deoxy-L-arabinose transferase-like glycosyltransferase
MMRPLPAADRIIVSRWILAAAVFLSFFWQLGRVPLYDLDEGAFTEATREMLASGNYITPYSEGEPRYDKPILIYWLQAASVKLLGLNEAALRLPSVLAATLWVIFLWRFVRERLDEPTATVAALVMTLTLEVSLIAKAAVADAVLNLFLALAFFELYRSYLRPESRFAVRAFLWMGLGFLTKGPVAVFFPVVGSLLFFLSEGAFRPWLRAATNPRGWLVFVLVALPWYLAIYLENGPGFFESFFLRHNLGRFEGPMHGHGGSPFYYFWVLPLVLLPFTGWFLRLLPILRRTWSDPLDRFCWIWFLLVFSFFSFSGTKLPHYLLYGASPLFILMARHRDLLVGRWLGFAPPVLFFLVLLFLPQEVRLAASHAHKLYQTILFNYAEGVLDVAYLAATGLGLALLLSIALWRRLRVWHGLLLAGFIQTAVVFGVLVPRVFEVIQAPVKEAALLARRLNLPTVIYRTSMPSFSVYRQAITPDRPPSPGDLVFLRIDKLSTLAAEYPQLHREVLFRRGPVALVKVTAAPRHG